MIYLDNAATTQIEETAFNAMLPFLKGEYGNASAVYELARNSKRAVFNARKQCAAVIGATTHEVFFTSGGTESDNWALIGAYEAWKMKQGDGSAVFRVDDSSAIVPDVSAGHIVHDTHKKLVDALPGMLFRYEIVHESSFDFAISFSFLISLCSFLKITGDSTTTATPTVTKESATLKVGNRVMIKSGKSQSIKSTTIESRIRSIKFPTAPPRIITTPSRLIQSRLSIDL